MTTVKDPLSANRRRDGVDDGGVLREGWSAARIGDIFESWGGMTPSTAERRFWGGSTPWISSKDVKADRIREGTEFVTDIAIRETRLRLAPSGSVLVVVRSGVLAHTLPVTIVEVPVVVNQDLKVFTCSEPELNRWLALALHVEAAAILNESRKDGTTVQSVGYPALKELEIPIPPVAEQRRICAQVEGLLARTAAARERLARIQKITERFRLAVIVAAMSGRVTADWSDARATDARSDMDDDRPVRTGRRRSKGASRTLEQVVADLPGLPEFPAGWQLVRVSDVSFRLQYGTSDRANAEAKTGTPILRMGNIQDGRLDLSDLKYVAGHSGDLSKFALERGDLLFNRTNSPELVGKTAVVTTDLDAVFASYLIRVQLDPGRADPDFVCYWLNSFWGREWASAVKTDGVSQSNINATKLAEMPVPLPPLAEQHEIVRRVGALLALADAVEQRVEAARVRAERLTPAILAKAFRGELVPTEAEVARHEGRTYEPASVLLERIREDKAAKAGARLIEKRTSWTDARQAQNEPPAYIPRLTPRRNVAEQMGEYRQGTFEEVPEQ